MLGSLSGTTPSAEGRGDEELASLTSMSVLPLFTE